MENAAKAETPKNAAHVVVKLVLHTKEAIKADQDGIRKTLLGLDAAVHANAVQCMLHAEKHGDTSLMTRLLVDVLADSGYRAQGLINWMRKHSPMELKAKVINLQGTFNTLGDVAMAKKAFPDLDHTGWDVGAKRPFLIEQANQNPFWTDSDNAERVAKPVYQATLLSPIDKMVKDMERAIENTVNGKPVDPSKPFYDGIHSDKVVDFVKKVAEMRAELPQDDTREVRLAQKRIADDQAFVEARTKAG